MTATLSPWEVAARHFQAKVRRWASPGAMATALDRNHKQTLMLNHIDAELVDLFDGDDDRGLMLFCPPQEGKSQIVSRRTPAWLLSHDPTLRIAVVSYQAKKAERWGKAVRRDIAAHPELGITLMSDSRASDRWETTAGGGMISVGIEGGITGEPVDCVRGDTRILTEYGYARIDEIHRAGAPFPRVLSYNHQAGRAEWRPIVASRAISDRPLAEIRTGGGRVITCTADHRVYVHGRGYVAAADVQPGERLLIAGHRADRLRELLNGVHQAKVHSAEAHAGHPAVLLPSVQVGVRDGATDLRGVWDGLLQGAGRSREGQAQRVHPDVLHQGVLSGHTNSREAAGGAPRRKHPDREVGHVGDPANSFWPQGLLRSRGCRAVRPKESRPGVRELRESPQVEEPYMPGVLFRSPRFDVSDRDLLAVQRAVPAHARGGREEEAGRSDGTLLLAVLPRQVDVSPQRADDLPAVRRGVHRAGTQVLHARVPEDCPPAEEKEGVPELPDRVRVLQRSPGVLLSQVRERGALSADGRRGQLPLQGRDQLRRMVPADAPAHPGTRSGSVQGVHAAELPGADRTDFRADDEVQPLHSPSERGSDGQPAGESHRAVLRMPRHSPQVGDDTVSVVRHLHGVRDTVYDLQVGGNSNFFADEILVHNCLIIDDPVRGRAEAESPTYREAAWDWWESNGSTRMSSRGRVLLMMTRWHEADLAGMLLKQEPGSWRVVSIPAIAGRGDPLGRRPGEELVSVQDRKRGYFKGLQAKRSAYAFNSIYQQAPVAAEGNLFRRADFRYWQRMPADPGYHGVMNGRRLDLGSRVVMLDDCWRFLTVDLAASKKTSADWTVASVWAISLDGDLILLDRARSRVGEEDHWDLVRPLRERWSADTVFVESAFIGTTLVIDATAAGIPVQPLKAETDKLTRALPAASRVKQHRVWFPAHVDWLDDWCDELAAFPAAANDDQVDTLSYAARVVSAHWLPMESAVEVDARRAGSRDDGPIGQAYEAATGGSTGLDLMSIDY